MATDFKAMRLLAYRMAWMETQGLDISLIANVVRVLTVEAWLKFDSVAMQLLGLGGQLTPDSKYAPLGGIMEGMYRFDALQWFNRTGPSYTKSFIATHGLGMPEF
jgi:alkylation response protein AidB-like acyl-CoA dehydrogenase